MIHLIATLQPWRIPPRPQAGASSAYFRDEWYTPSEYIEAARDVMGDIDLDPATCAAAQDVIQAGTFFTKDDDGLVQPWHGRVWLNPPYSASLVQGFVDKLCAEYDAGCMTEGVVLVNNATDTAWFHRLLACFPACVLRRRVPFWRPGFSGGGVRQGQVIFYLGPNVDRFRNVFSSFGVVVSAWSGVAATGEET
jgi:ParB family chromosome partitioning protein